jgi:hypothetical protein
VPPNRGELRPQLRPGKITRCVVHDFEGVPQARSQSPSGIPHSSIDKLRPSTHWRGRLYPAGIFASAAAVPLIEMARGRLRYGCALGKLLWSGFSAAPILMVSPMRTRLITGTSMPSPTFSAQAPRDGQSPPSVAGDAACCHGPLARATHRATTRVHAVRGKMMVRHHGRDRA